MTKIELLILALLLALFLVACAPAPEASTPAAPAAATLGTPAVPKLPASVAPATPAKADWEVEWDKTVEAARKEGTLVLYTSLGGQQRQTVTMPFHSKYGVRVESVTGASAEIVPKVTAEQRAGIWSADAWIGGSGTYIQLKDALDSLDSVFVLPELTQGEIIKNTWYFREVPWANEAHTMVIGLMDAHTFISTNTSLVKAGEIKAYRDLLDPKWKGKLSVQDPRTDGMGRMWFAVALELGDIDVNYLRELLAKQEPFVTRDRRLQVDWLAKGKHAVAVAPHPAAVTEFIDLGAPINRFRVGTPSISGSSAGIAIMRRTPHPNAAKLFINWLLSKEGQTAHSQAIGAQAQRLDVSTAHLTPEKVLAPGLKPFKADKEEFNDKRATFYASLAKEVFGP